MAPEDTLYINMANRNTGSEKLCALQPTEYGFIPCR